MSDDLATLCADLAGLHRALGATTDADDALDRSSVMRPGLLWCTAHRAAHRRDEWAPGCAPGQDPRRVTARAVGSTLTPTAPNVSSRRRVPSSRPPLDLDALACQEGIDRAVMALYVDARAAHGWPRLTQIEAILALCKASVFAEESTGGGAADAVVPVADIIAVLQVP